MRRDVKNWKSYLKEGLGPLPEQQFFFLFCTVIQGNYGQEARLRISSSDTIELVWPPGPKLANRQWVYWEFTGCLLGGLVSFLWKQCLNYRSRSSYLLEKQTPLYGKSWLYESSAVSFQPFSLLLWPTCHRIQYFPLPLVESCRLFLNIDSHHYLFVWQKMTERYIFRI